MRKLSSGEEGVTNSLSAFQWEGSWELLQPRRASLLDYALDAPAVAFGVFKRPLHLFTQNFREDRSADRLRARRRDVQRSISTGQHPHERILHPFRFQV